MKKNYIVTLKVLYLYDVEVEAGKEENEETLKNRAIEKAEKIFYDEVKDYDWTEVEVEEKNSLFC